MLRNATEKEIESWPALSAEAQLPILVSDYPIHRRSSAHFLYMPGEPNPHVYRYLQSAMEHCLFANHATFLLPVDFDETTATMLQLTINRQQSKTNHG